VVGVGSDTIESVLDQLSVSYNAAHSKTHNAANPWIYSWDATPPNNPTNLTSMITPKAGCASILRPDGSGAGISALEVTPKDKTKPFNCFDFARSSRGRAATDPAKTAKNGVLFVVLAKDAVTWSASAKTNAPANLKANDLKNIYSCTVPATNGHPANNWADLGGKAGPIKPVLPQTGSGTRSFFLASIKVTAPGNCVNSTPEENEGVNAVFKGANAPNVIFPFSVGKYIAQAFHSAACNKKPGKGQNSFGCDAIGNLKLKKIGGTSPTVGGGKKPVTINPAFASIFQRLVYDVVPTANTSNHIPSRLQRFLDPASNKKAPGYFCGAAAKKILINYGFLPTPECGIGL
jgi:hypothetical protein